jgi:hypothetical protein
MRQLLEFQYSLRVLDLRHKSLLRLYLYQLRLRLLLVRIGLVHLNRLDLFFLNH